MSPPRKQHAPPKPGVHVPFHRVPNVTPVKCWFLNATVVRGKP